MVDFQRLLDQAAAPIAPSNTGVDAGPVLNNPFLQKEQQLAQAAAEKKATLAAEGGANNPMAGFPDFYGVAAGMGNQSGALSMDPLEQDLRTMQPLDLYLKYGPSAIDLLNDMAAGGTAYFQDTLQRNNRTAPEVLFDSATGIVGTGFIGGLANLGAFGVGLIDEDAGTWSADKVQQGMQWLEGQQSDGVNAARRIQRATSALDQRDNALLRQQEIDAGGSELVADLRRWGRDTVDTLGNSIGDPVMLGQGTSEAVGSLLAGGPISKGLKALGAPIANAMRASGPLTRNADRLIRAGRASAWPAAIAGLEAGGAYTGTATDVLSMSYEDLEKNSPTFRELVAGGMTQEDARIRVANQSALFAAAIQAPIAAATGTLTRFAETPFRVPSVGSALRNIGSETVEESIQSTTGGLAQNIATRRYADETKSLSEGVGEQTAQGALYGMTAAGTVQAPGVGARLAYDGGRAAYQGTRAAAQVAMDAGRPLFNALIERGDRIIREAERASPVADDAISAAAETLATAAPQDVSTISEAVQQSDATPEQKAEAQSFMESLANNLLVDVNDESLPEQHRQVIQGSITRADAIQRMAREVARTEGQDQLMAAGTLWYLLEPMQSLQESDPQAFDSIPQDHPASTLLRDYTKLVADIDNTPSVQRALRAINEMVAKAQSQQNIQPVTEESLGTVEGQQNVRNALAVASLHPDKGNLEANEQILTHAANGRLNLSPQQLGTLRASVELLRARQKLEAEIAAKGIRSAKDVVSSQVVAGNDPLRKIAKSALQHTQGILSAMRGQNNDLASVRLEDFGRFVQHMQNKVEALNQHFRGGDPYANPVKYMALQPTEDRDFKESRDGMYVNTRSPKSIDQAQSIALEANILADVYNGLVQTFPELSQPQIQSASLVPELEGNPSELVRQFRNPTPAQETVTSGQEVNAQEVQSTGTTEGEAERVDSGTEAQPEEGRARSELSDENQASTILKDGRPAILTFSQNGDMASIEVTVEGEQVGTLNYNAKTDTVADVEVEPEFRRLGIAQAMYRFASEKGNDLQGQQLEGEARHSLTEDGANLRSGMDTSNVTLSRVEEPTSTGLTPEQQAIIDQANTLIAQAAEETQDTATPPTNVAGAFPNLFTGVRNFFIESFQFPREPKTRLYAEESPAATIRRALSSNLRFQSFLSGSQARNTLTMEVADAYQGLLSDAAEGNTLGHLLKIANDNLQAFLQKGNNGEKFRNGTEANRWRNGKVLNLVEDVDGTFQYNQQLLEEAGLAAMQWLLSANQYETNMDEQDVSDLTGIPVVQLTPEMIERVTQGMSMEQAVHSLGQKISNYWGLDAKRDAYKAYSEGIPQAMASEMIRGLRDMGLLNIETTEVRKEDFTVDENRTIQRYIPARLNDNDPLRSFQDAIESAVMVDPEHTNFFGEERPAVAQRQMNNPEVANTNAQKDALQKEQETPFYINRPMVNFFTSLGRDNLLRLFGTVITDPEQWNVNHITSLEGQNQSIVSAYNHMLDVVYDLQNFAQTANQSMDDVAIRYGYNMSRVGRMQMLGKYNPQASKLVREAFLPTRVTIDLSNQNDANWDAYTLGLAQAMGIKVHNQPVEISQMKLGEMLNGGLAPAVQMIQEWLNQTDLDDPSTATVQLTSEQTEQIRTAFSNSGADLTMASLHALVDYARLQNTSDRSNFTTSVYLEADGVTNGPINAMALMTIGSFQQDWLDNIRKGGLSIGPERTLSDIRTQGTQADGHDLYQASTDATRGRLSELREQLNQQEEGDRAIEQMGQLLSLMDLFSSDVMFDPDRAWEDGALEMKRGIAKNPLTITVYGSGAAGIAGKLVGQLTTEIYARMSQVIKARNANPNVTLAEAMFPNDPDAQGKMDRFQAAYNALTRFKPTWSRGQLVFEEVGQRRNTFDPKTFTFEKSELEAMEANMLQLFVQPMRQGIEDTVGSPLMKAVGILRDAAQVQSVILENQFVQAIDQAIADKEANDPNWKKGDFLMDQDLQKIQRDLRNISPLVQTGEQTFMVASSQRLEVRGNDLEISAALDDTMRAGPSIYAPGQAGVRAIPMLTIGMGDGMMMQLLAQLGLEGTLKIFDGMNMPLDKITQYSRQANEAVYESWKGNPLREVSKSFDRFMKNFDDSFINEQTYEPLTRVLFTPQERSERARSKNPTFSVAEIRDRMDTMQSNLSWSAESIDARHEAVQSMPVSIDQMAAAGAPYHNGRSMTNFNPDTVLEELNRRYNTIMERGKLETQEVSVAPVQHVAPTKPTPEVEKVGRVSSTGARVLSWTALTNLGRMNVMTEAQKTIFDEIRRSLSARDYKVITGTVEQLDAYIEEKGLSTRPNQEVFGWTNVGDKTIYLVNPSMETLVHELVHAASYETVLAHYSGDNLGTNSAAIKEAIGRLETMMEEFLSLDQASMDPSFRAAYDSARQAILSANLESDQAVAQAKALNEFMAWSLTNEQLTKNLKQKQAPRLVQLAKDAIKAIKNLIWGRKTAPKAVDDFLSNLQFNSGIVIRSQPSISMINRNGELFHAPAYGTNDRLKEVRTSIGKKVVDLLASEQFQKDKQLRQVEVSDAQMLAIDVALAMNAHGFPMTMQESATFRMIVAALATEAELDANALARAQELYSHVAKNLTVEHFMEDPESLDPSMRYYAQEKYDAVMGKHLTRTDAKGRSSLLPAFLGLATVSDEFRTVLSRLPVPARTKNSEGTLDAMLENVTNSGMDALSRRLSGDVKSKDVLKAVDNLVEHIKKVAQDEQTFIDQYTKPAGGVIDRMNDYLRGSMEKLSDIAMEKASEVEKNSKPAINRTAARMTRLLASVVSEKNGAIVAEQTMVMLNKSNIWEPFHTLMNDLIGRTQSNALVYDMIKVTRSMVQQVRQQFREETPRIIMSKFKGKMTDAQWGTMFRAMGKSDLAVLRDTMSHSEIQNLFQDQTALDGAINTLEQQIQANDPKHWNLIQSKARQLATFMNTGVPGRNLLRNANSVAGLYGETVARGYKIPQANIIKAIDKLVTLYSVEMLPESDRTSMASLVQGEAEGLSFTLDYLVGQRKEETAKAATGKARINAYKGFIPSEQQQGVSMTVADDANFASLRERGFIRVANYQGSSTERSKSRGYYYSPLSGRAVFNQGIMQNVRHTAGGVDAVTGFTIAQQAGRITDRHMVRRLSVQMKNEKNLNEALMPIYNEYGQVIALERPIDPVQWDRMQPSQHLPRMIGIWRGRQAEEGMAQIYNEKLIDGLRKMYDEDMKISSSNQKQYVNLLDSKSLSPVQQDAVNLFTDQTMEYVREVFGDEFWVRKDMLADSIGYRSASVGDLWTGNSNWSPEALDTMKKLVTGVFGIEAYRYMVKGEQVIQNFMADARTLIVIKSVIVPAINFTSNIYHLISRGVPITSIARGLPRKLGEIDNYAKTRLRQIDAEAELRATENPIEQRKLKAEIQSITDAHKRLSIWPLIQAGEFSTIADVGMTNEDLELTSGKLGQYMEKMVNKLPESVRNAGRYALVTRDTALFQGLQKSVQYGDFVAKAVLFEDLTKRQNKTQAEALARITEEFVNYDRLPGRFRSYLENMGLLWFYNFKIRISKVAVSTIRNNPVHALLAMTLPTPDLFGNVDLPQADSLFSKLWDGTLDYSMGPEMGLRAPFLNPWYNLVH